MSYNILSFLLLIFFGNFFLTQLYLSAATDVKRLAQYAISPGVSGPLGLHREIEALKHVFAVRMNLGDPDFVHVSKVLSDMLSPKFAKELKKQIFDNMTFDPSHYGGR